MNQKKKIILISRGMRLASFFKELAKELARDYGVIVFLEKPELKFWSDMGGIEGIELKDSEKEFESAVRQSGKELNSLVTQIEDELNLPLFKAAAHFILYKKFTKRSLSRWKMKTVDNPEAMLRDYAGSYLVFSWLFKDDPPELIFYESPELVSTRVAAEIARQNNVFSLGFRFAQHVWDDKPRIWLTYGWRAGNVLLETYYKAKHLIKPDSYQNGRCLIAKMKERYESPIYHKAHKRQAEGFSNWKYFLPMAAWKFFYGLLTLQPRKYIRVICNIAWLNRYLRRDLPKEPFIAFFLSFQPETTTSAQVPRWVNLDMVIEQLAINGPAGLKILVKEHPRNLGYRGKGYFRDFLGMHNVHLCHPRVDTYAIISNAQAILTLTGTVGFEGIVLGKKVAVLGRPYYSVFEGVRKLDYPEEIFIALNDASWNPEELGEARDAFVAAYAQSLYEFGAIDGKRYFHKAAGNKCADAIKDFLRKKSELNIKPDMFDKGY